MKKKKDKKFSDTYINFGNIKVSAESLRKEINDMDKEFGIKLKHAEIFAEPENYKHIIEANADFNIAAIICILNGIPLEEYFEIDKSKNRYGMVCKPLGPNSPTFVEDSLLRLSDKKTCYNIDSLLFRCRFLTYSLIHLVGRLDKVSSREAKIRYKMNHSIDEKQIILYKHIVNNCILFAKLLITPGANFKNIILKMNEYFQYTKKSSVCNHRELQTLLNGHIIYTRKSMKKDVITGERFFDDDIAIYQTLKIAYMLATGKTNLGCIPRFKYIKNATVEHDLVKLIEALGESILENRKINKLCPMFNAFILARPKIWTQYNKKIKENVAIKMGFIALAYAKFVYNDKTMNKFIDKMMQRGK